MTPWRPGKAHPYPVIVGKKIRPLLDYKMLDLRLRVRIRARHHEKGVSFSPVHDDDVEAKEWIAKQAARYGTMKWTRKGWVKEKSKIDPGVR